MDTYLRSLKPGTIGFRIVEAVKSNGRMTQAELRPLFPRLTKQTVSSVVSRLTRYHHLIVIEVIRAPSGQKRNIYAPGDPSQFSPPEEETPMDYVAFEAKFADLMAGRRYGPPSANGRPAPFEGVNGGSNPSGGTT